jgi:hypothetical protein
MAFSFNMNFFVDRLHCLAVFIKRLLPRFIIVAPYNGDRHFSELFNVRRQQSSDVTIAVSYIISALISCNFIIKNYVHCKKVQI